ncbi:hypothetical protein DPM19_08570 [Actinomadura craniellae]|uniref:YdhG-like domain-containing protein n=2 Tax=Actinomadura craniellae TaxID=2231787 RepID=A0A365HAI6_9ACTN|nr:hypothetical protein DPM19_08570 [Actinomadura craniellae]
MDGRPQEIEEWLERWSPEQRARVEALAARVHAAGGEVTEAIKWGRLTFTVRDDWHHWLCAVAVTDRVVNLVFHKGVLLDDPADLLRGAGRYLRHVPYTEAAAHPEAVEALVRRAVARQTDMLPD